MEAGFIPNTKMGQVLWYEGEAPKKLLAILTFRRPGLVVMTHRCSVCGYLELYVKA